MFQATRHPLDAPCAWHGRDMAASSRWLRDLSARDLAEIDSALKSVQKQGLAWHEVTAEKFPLPSLRKRLLEIAEELEEGCGMVKLRSLPVERYSLEELRQIWFGVGCHLGR